MTEPRKVEETERSMCCSSSLLSAGPKGKAGPQPDKDSFATDQEDLPTNKELEALEAPTAKSRASGRGSQRSGSLHGQQVNGSNGLILIKEQNNDQTPQAQRRKMQEEQAMKMQLKH